jgi:CO/xanthine dehydrogenase FAD-binding subunit
MQHFDFHMARSKEEALDFLSQAKGPCKVLAGGTDLIPSLRKEEFLPDYVLNILEIESLKGISEEGNEIRIGPTTTFSDIMESEFLARNLPLLVQAAASVGGPQVRNRGTIGGNILTASPAADLLPAVMALDAFLELDSKRSGRRRVPISDSIEAPYRPRIGPDELLTGVLIRKPVEGTRFGFIKLGRRKALARARMNLSISLSLGRDGAVSDIRIVPGAVMPVARRVTEAEEILRGKALALPALEEADKAITDVVLRETGIRRSTEYKLPVLASLFKRLFRQLAEQPPGRIQG